MPAPFKFGKAWQNLVGKKSTCTFLSQNWWQTFSQNKQKCALRVRAQSLRKIRWLLNFQNANHPTENSRNPMRKIRWNRNSWWEIFRNLSKPRAENVAPFTTGNSRNANRNFWSNGKCPVDTYPYNFQSTTFFSWIQNFHTKRIQIEFACPHASDGIQIHSRETTLSRFAATLVYCSVRDWTQVCLASLSTSMGIYFFHSGERIKKYPDLLRNSLDACGRKPYP